jgi:hypothetical protein
MEIMKNDFYAYTITLNNGDVFVVDSPSEAALLLAEFVGFEPRVLYGKARFISDVKDVTKLITKY